MMTRRIILLRALAGAATSLFIGGITATGKGLNAATDKDTRLFVVGSSPLNGTVILIGETDDNGILHLWSDVLLTSCLLDGLPAANQTSRESRIEFGYGRKLGQELVPPISGLIVTAGGRDLIQLGLYAPALSLFLRFHQALITVEEAAKNNVAVANAADAKRILGIPSIMCPPTYADVVVPLLKASSLSINLSGLLLGPRCTFHSPPELRKW